MPGLFFISVTGSGRRGVVSYGSLSCRGGIYAARGALTAVDRQGRDMSRPYTTTPVCPGAEIHE